MAGGRCNNF